MVCCPTHIAGNRCYLKMTDVPDIVDVFVGTALGTSAHCFVSCVLRVEQFVPESNIRSIVFLKHRTNLYNVRCPVRSFTWSTILKSADTLDYVRLVRLFLPLVCVVEFGDKQWFDVSCWRAYGAKQTAYHAWCRAFIPDHWVDLCLLVLRPRGSMVLQGSHIMNAPGIL